MQDDCPDSVRFQYSTVDSVCTAPNGSKIFLFGCNEDKGRSARGTSMNIAVCDEVGFFTYPEVIKDVIAPQLRTTNGKLIIASTPPNDLGHYWYKEKVMAIKDGRFRQKTIFDDESLTPDVLAQIEHDCGGKESTTFRREYLCEAVSDPERLVIPEFNEATHVGEEVPPEYYDAYVGCDLGLNDFTALVFGYYNFHTDTLVIQDELVVQGKNSKEIVEAAKAIEKRLWNGKPPYLRVSDNELQQLYDMSSLFGYEMVPTRKDDKLSAINQLRDRFVRGKIKIHPRCEVLRFQLKVGLWNDARTNYLRSSITSSLGHLDAVDSLIYLSRNINTHKNPTPVMLGVTPQTHHIERDLPKPMGKDEETLKNIFEIFK